MQFVGKPPSTYSETASVYTLGYILMFTFKKKQFATKVSSMVDYCEHTFLDLETILQ